MMSPFAPEREYFIYKYASSFSFEVSEVSSRSVYPELRLGAVWGCVCVSDHLNLSSMIVLVPKNCCNYFPWFNISKKKKINAFMSRTKKNFTEPNCVCGTLRK